MNLSGSPLSHRSPSPSISATDGWLLKDLRRSVIHRSA